MEHTEEDAVPLPRPGAPAWSPFAPPGANHETSAPPGANHEPSAPPDTDQENADRELGARSDSDHDSGAPPGAAWELGGLPEAGRASGAPSNANRDLDAEWGRHTPPGSARAPGPLPGAVYEYSVSPAAPQAHGTLPQADRAHAASAGLEHGAPREHLAPEQASGEFYAEEVLPVAREHDVLGGAASSSEEVREEPDPYRDPSPSGPFNTSSGPVRQAGPPAPTSGSRLPAVPVPSSFPDQPGALERVGVTADDFASRRVVPPRAPVAETGLRGALHRLTFGLLAFPPSARERAHQHAIDTVRRNFGGLRQVTVVNPKGGAGKTVAVLMLAMTFGRHRGGYVLAWDNNETQGTLGMRAQQDFHVRTVRDLLRDLDHFRGPTGRVGDLSQYVRAQGGAMFDVLASDESATAGEMLTAGAFGDLREAVSRFYKLIVVDTGNNVRAHNWQAAIDATDQLVVTMSARNDSAETAARMLDHLEQTGRRDLVRNAVSVVSMPAHRKDVDLPAVQRHFAARTRAVLLAPYEKLLDSGEPIRYESLSKASLGAWLRIGSAVAEGL